MKTLPKPRKEPLQARSLQMVDIILEATARVLAERGYAGTNTNLIAERAGVSVGSIYQYFPNKDALVTALHERHANQMYDIINAVLQTTQPISLAEHIQAIVHAQLAAHQLSPALHKVLEHELPFFDAPREQSPADNSIFQRVHTLLTQYRDEIVQPDLKLATWTILQVCESLVHAATIEPPTQFTVADIESAISRVIIGYLKYSL